MRLCPFVFLQFAFNGNRNIRLALQKYVFFCSLAKEDTIKMAISARYACDVLSSQIPLTPN